MMDNLSTFSEWQPRIGLSAVEFLHCSKQRLKFGYFKQNLTAAAVLLYEFLIELNYYLLYYIVLSYITD